MPQNIFVGISNTKTTTRVLSNLRLKRNFGTAVTNCSELVPRSHPQGTPRSTARTLLPPRGTQSSPAVGRMSAQPSGSPDGRRPTEAEASDKGLRNSRPPGCRRLTAAATARLPRSVQDGPPRPTRVSTSPALTRPQTAGLCESEREDTCRHRTRDRDGVKAANAGPLAVLEAPDRAAGQASPHRARRALPSPPPPAAGPVPWRDSSRRGASGGDRAALTLAQSEECDRGLALRLPPPPASVPARRLLPRYPAWVTERMRAPLPSPFHSACARPSYRRRGHIARRAAGLALPALPPALGEGLAGAS